MSTKSQSSVISFKLLPSEIYIWKGYAMSIGKTPSTFLIKKVDRYLSLNSLEEDYDSEKTLKSIKKSRKYKDLLKIEGNEVKNGRNRIEKETVSLINVSLRINKTTLEEWDNYRELRYISRTALIRQTLNSFFDRRPDRLSLVINSLICEVGSIDFQRLQAIFSNQVDSSKLIQVLNKLEEEGTITRKGSWDNYVPTNPPENRGGSVMLGELLTRFI